MPIWGYPILTHISSPGPEEEEAEPVPVTEPAPATGKDIILSSVTAWTDDQLGTWIKAAHFLLDLLAHLRVCKARPESVTKGWSRCANHVQLQEKEEAPGNLVVYLARSQLYWLSLRMEKTKTKPSPMVLHCMRLWFLQFGAKIVGTSTRSMHHLDGWVKSQGFWHGWWWNHIFPYVWCFKVSKSLIVALLRKLLSWCAWQSFRWRRRAGFVWEWGTLHLQ